jgi:hypothetical protein
MVDSISETDAGLFYLVLLFYDRNVHHGEHKNRAMAKIANAVLRVPSVVSRHTGTSREC